MKFRRKPVTIDAELYRQGLEDGFEKDPYYELQCVPSEPIPYINTLEGKMYISPGDWIITGIKGERYPCKAHIFPDLYEPAQEG